MSAAATGLLALIACLTLRYGLNLILSRRELRRRVLDLCDAVVRGLNDRENPDGAPVQGVTHVVKTRTRPAYWIAVRAARGRPVHVWGGWTWHADVTRITPDVVQKRKRVL